MDVSPIDPAAFSGRVPIFPLPDVVLFPHGVLPLHIFEPRYREMTEAALGGERLIAMALLKPGWEADYAGNPPVHEVVGVGRIAQHERLEGGRFNLILFGMARAEIVEVVSGQPYRTARVRLLEDRIPEGRGYERKRRILRQFCSRMIGQVLGAEGEGPPQDLPLGALCDLLASYLRLDPPMKQKLLEEVDAGARCDLLLSLLQAQDPPGASGSAWPPRASSN